MYLTSLTHLECSDRTSSPRLLLPSLYANLQKKNVIAVATYPCIFNQSLMLFSALHPVVCLQLWAHPEVDCRVGVSAYAMQPLRIPRSYVTRLSLKMLSICPPW